MNRGLNLILEKQQRSDEDWVFGALSQPCIASIPMEEREKYLPVGELQNIGEEKFWCSTAGALNLLETKFIWLLQNKKLKPENEKWLRDNGYVENERVLFSDSYISILSGTTRTGNSLKAPLRAIENNGLIPKSLLPQLNGFDETYNPARITQKMKDLGQEFRKRFTINYEIVYETHYGEELKDDLLNVAGYAWPEPINGEYPKTDGQPNHVFVAFNLPKYFIYDSYLDAVDQDFIKKLASDFDLLDYGYRIFISSQTTLEERKIQLSVFDILFKNKLLSFFADWWERFVSIFRPAIIEEPEIPNLPEPPLPEPLPEPPKYLWDTPANVRHSIRVIGDELGMTWLMKDLACDICRCESNFNPNAKRVNNPKSVDRGLFQINNFYHKEVSDEQAFDPEYNTRWACRALLNGKAKIYWNASFYCWGKNGKYNNLI